jgi:hypothetical protein
MAPDPQSHAARQRRYQRRQRDGDTVVTVALSQQHTAKLVRLGCLALERLDDRGAIADALRLVLDAIDDDQARG